MSTFDTAGEPSPEEVGGEGFTDAASAERLYAEANQTVTNDAVAGETIDPNVDGLPTTPEAAPEEDELVAANDGYLAPSNQTGEEVDLGDEGESGEVRVSPPEPDLDAFSAGLHP